MSTWTPTDRRAAIWSAIAVVFFGVAYIITGAIWFLTSTDSRAKQSLQPTEPFLAILEILILLSTLALVVLFAAIHAYASPDRKTCSLAAFGFVILLVVLTGVVHFVQLTVVRRTMNPTVVELLRLYSPDNRLSVMLAMDLLGWDLFFGFAMLFAAPVFIGGKVQTVIRVSLILSGLLCLVGVAGPASGDMRFQVPAILGYAFGLPFVSFLLARLFARKEPHAEYGECND